MRYFIIISIWLRHVCHFKCNILDIICMIDVK